MIGRSRQVSNKVTADVDALKKCSPPIKEKQWAAPKCNFHLQMSKSLRNLRNTGLAML